MLPQHHDEPGASASTYPMILLASEGVSAGLPDPGCRQPILDIVFDLLRQNALEPVLLGLAMGHDFAYAPEFQRAEIGDMWPYIDVGRIGRHHMRRQRMHHDLG